MRLLLFVAGGNSTFHIDFALHKHAAHMNILSNPDEDLRKEFTFRGMGGGRQEHPSSTSSGIAKTGASNLQIRMDLVNKYLRPFVIEHLDS